MDFNVKLLAINRNVFELSQYHAKNEMFLSYKSNGGSFKFDITVLKVNIVQ